MKNRTRAVTLYGTLFFATSGCADVLGLNELEKVDALAPTSFCATANPQHLFCADFDEGKDVASGWATSHASNGATLTLDTKLFKTAPASASSVVTTAAGKTAAATLEQNVELPRPSGLLILAFDLNVASADSHPAGSVQLASLAFGTAGNKVAFVWTATGPNVVITLPSDSGLASKSYPVKPAPTLGAFSHVEIDLGLTQGSMGSLVVTVDSKTALMAEAIPTEAAPTESVALTLGVVVGTTPTSFSANFDDVTVDFN